MINDYYDFAIAGHFLSALINGDYTGLDDNEAKQLDQFVNHWQVLQSATWDCLTEHPDLNICDITGLLAATHKTRLYFHNDKLPAGLTFDAFAD